MTPEHQRLAQARAEATPWKLWGPYLSERQWGTVREDYSADGNAWDYFTHDQSRSRAYRWGEDGLGGICDDRQLLCFALALWNGRDPILKERLFGLSNSEGNHGEDVKEYYYYLDSTPTHSYMKFLYKYPHNAFPYQDLVETNRRRSRLEPEYELIDTGIFGDDAYFDVFIEYAKNTPDDILITITVHNRGSQPAMLHLLPTLWFRNTWSWSAEAPKPNIKRVDGGAAIAAIHHQLGAYYLHFDRELPLLFTENETNDERIFFRPNRQPYVKDGINTFLVEGRTGAVNPGMTGTKACGHYPLTIAGLGSDTLRLRLTTSAPKGKAARGGTSAAAPIGGDFDEIVALRRTEADAFYAALLPAAVSDDEKRVARQALAGMLWTKQVYIYDVYQWLEEHGVDPVTDRKSGVRNREWYTMSCHDIISMPDKWEYPWFAAWDLAFHAIPLALVDPVFAKEQLALMLSHRYLHPNGQIPAYEWHFGDVNPPVHAWATKVVYDIDKAQRGGEGDISFLKRSFRSLVMNFTWWVNRKDPDGNNVFGGGFLGLDNIGVFDRSAPLPTGGTLEQSDGTAWMAFYAASMLEIAIELALHDPTYDDAAYKFLEHFLWIAATMDRIGVNHDDLWDEEDGFFYDVLRLPDGSGQRLKVRSVAGLLPLCAMIVIPKPEPGGALRRIQPLVESLLAHRPKLTATIAPPLKPGVNGRLLLSPVTEDKLRRILKRLLDESEFLSPYGIRSLSRAHRDQPYIFTVGRSVFRVDYEPADSTSGMFGGNSNWRGPVWLPVNFIILRSLLHLYSYYGDSLTVEHPTGSGRQLTLAAVVEEILQRLIGLFRRDEAAGGRRPVFGDNAVFQNDPHWRDHLLFYEYFNGDTGAGVGASHQTGWTGLVAFIIQYLGMITPADVLAKGAKVTVEEIVPEGEGGVAG